MVRVSTPTIETTKNFILIKIPRTLFRGKTGRGKISSLERGLAQSLRQAQRGELYGPFSNAKDLLRALKKPIR